MGRSTAGSRRLPAAQRSGRLRASDAGMRADAPDVPGDRVERSRARGTRSAWQAISRVERQPSTEGCTGCGRELPSSRPAAPWDARRPAVDESVGVVVTRPRAPRAEVRVTRSATARSGGSKRSMPSASQRSHRCGSSSRPWSSDERVVHLPEPALERGRLGGVGEHARAGVLGDHREVAEDRGGSGGRSRMTFGLAQYGHSRSAYSITSGPRRRGRGPRAAGGGGLGS